MKKEKTYYGWLFAVISLVILLGVSIYLGISGWYFQTDYSLSSDIELGNTIELEVHKNQANSVSFTFSGAYLPGEKLPQIISVKNADESGELYLRAKLFVYTSGNEMIDMQLIETVNWVHHDDGYYYFNDKLMAQAKLGLCSDVQISPDSFFKGDTSYIMTVLVETLDSTLDPQVIWNYTLD